MNFGKIQNLVDVGEGKFSVVPVRISARIWGGDGRA